MVADSIQCGLLADKLRIKINAADTAGFTDLQDILA
jgi:hypothetical protein